MTLSRQQHEVLHALRVAPGNRVAGSTFLAMRIPRYAARLLELKARGYNFTKRHIGKGQYEYRLVSEPDIDVGADGSLSAVLDPSADSSPAVSVHMGVEQLDVERGDGSTSMSDRWSATVAPLSAEEEARSIAAIYGEAA